MASTTGLNYLITVQLDRLKDLQDLRDTIRDIKQLASQDSEFTIKVNPSSVASIQQQIQEAVSVGLSRAGGRALSNRTSTAPAEPAPAPASSGGAVDPAYGNVDMGRLGSAITHLANMVGRLASAPRPQGGGVQNAPMASGGGSGQGEAVSREEVGRADRRVRELRAKLTATQQLMNSASESLSKQQPLSEDQLSTFDRILGRTQEQRRRDRSRAASRRTNSAAGQGDLFDTAAVDLNVDQADLERVRQRAAVLAGAVARAEADLKEKAQALIRMTGPQRQRQQQQEVLREYTPPPAQSQVQPQVQPQQPVQSQVQMPMGSRVPTRAVLAQTEQALGVVNDIILKNIQSTPNIEAAIRRPLGRKYTQELQDLEDKRDLGAVTIEEYENSKDTLNSYEHIRKSLEGRVSRLRARASWQSPEVMPSAGGVGGTVTGLDTSTLVTAFERGARVMGDAIRQAMQDAAMSVGEAVRQALGSGGGAGFGDKPRFDYGPVTREEAARSLDTFRPTGYGETLEQLRATRDNYAEDRDDKLAQQRTLEASIKSDEELLKKALADRERLRAEGKRVPNIAANSNQFQTLEKELRERQALLTNKEIKLERQTDPAKRSELEAEIARMKTKIEDTKRDLRQVILEAESYVKRVAEGNVPINGQAVAGDYLGKPNAANTGFQSVGAIVRRLEVNRAARQNLSGEQAVLEQHIANVQADIEGKRANEPQAAMSRRQLAATQAEFERDPGSHASLAARRAARFLENLSTRDRDLFQQASDAGVMALPDIPERLMSARVKTSPQFRLIEEELQGLRRVQGGTNDRIREETDPGKRRELAVEADKIQAQIEQKELERTRVLYEAINKAVASAVTQYRARLAEDRGKKLSNPQLTGEQALKIDQDYDKKMNALNFSTQRMSTLMAGDPDIAKQVVLFPQQLAQYIRDTLNKYTGAVKKMRDSGTAIPAELQSEIDMNPLLSLIAGRAPANQKEAAAVFANVVKFQKEFDAAKTAYEKIAPRGIAPLPIFNPRLSVDTVPFEGSDREDLKLTEEQKIRWLKGFRRRGGAWAEQTEERRVFAEEMYKKYQNRVAEGSRNLPGTIFQDIADLEKQIEILKERKPDVDRSKLEARLRTMKDQVDRVNTATENDRKQALIWGREVEWGGRYYYQNSPMASRGDIDAEGMLLAPKEQQRVKRGGVRSAGVGNPFATVDAPAMTMETRVAKEFLDTMGGVEGALARVTKTLQDLSGISMAPVIAQLKEMGEAIKPYLAGLQAAAKLSDSAKSTSAKIEERRQIVAAAEEEKTKGELARLRDRYKAAKAVGGKDATPEQLLQALFANKGVPRPPAVPTYVPPELVGAKERPTTVPLLSTEAPVLRDLVIRGRQQIGTTQVRMQDLLAMNAALIGQGLPTASNERSIQRTSSTWDAQMGTYAANVSALSQADPRFFRGGTPAVQGAAQTVLSTLNQRNEVGSRLKAVTDAQVSLAQLEKELENLKALGNDESAKKRRQDLEQQRGKLLGFVGNQFGALEAAGVVPKMDKDLFKDAPIAKAAAQVEVMRKRYGELNGELGKTYDQLLAVTNQSVQAAAEGGSFPERVISKLRNLSAYVTAGGLVYTLASELRMAASEAVGLEADLKRIQGVLETRSGGQARAIGQGILASSTEFGTPLRQSVQSAKLFAQTGADPNETLKLTRASLAAQVGADLEAGQATELLIAVQNITDRQVQSFDILDRISRIEAQYAVSASDLSNSIQRAGSLAKQLQPQALGAVDALDLIIGASTTIIERTRVTGEQAATSLRFIISRLAAPEVARALQDRFNINLAGDTPNTLRPLQDILSDISDRYKQLRESGQTVQAQQLLATFAGARQSNVAAALLDDFGKTLRVANESALAYGDTQARVQLQLDTVSSRLTQFNTAFVGFASTILNDTGLNGLLKGILGAGTGVLNLAQSDLGIAQGAGTLGLAGGIAATGLAAGRLGQGAAGLAGRLGTAGIAGAVGRGAASVGTGLASIAGGAGPVAGIVVALGTIIAIMTAIDRRSQRQAVRESDPFDREEFRNSDFYRNYEETATGFGLSTSSLSDRVEKAFFDASRKVQGDVASGRLPMNQQYNETLKEVVKTLDKVLPGFVSLGDQAQRAAQAMALVRETARFNLAIPDTYTASFRKDLDDLFSEVEKSTTDLRKTLKNSGTTMVPGPSFSGQAVPVRLGFSMDEFFKQFSYLGKQFLNPRGLMAVGTNKSFEELVKTLPAGREVEALDEYARQYLFVSKSQREQIERINDQLAAQNKRNNLDTFTAEAVSEAKRRGQPMSEEQITDLQAARSRYNNQQVMAGDIVRQINAALGNSNNERVNALVKELGGSTDLPGDAFATAFKQAVEVAKQRVAKEIKTLNENAKKDGESPSVAQTRKDLEALESSLVRMSQKADLVTTSVKLRDRLFEPIVGYASRMAEIGTEERLAQRFGTNFDSVAARSQAARQFLIASDQVPIRMLQDRIRLSASIMNGAAGARDVQRGIRLNDDGGPIPGTTNAQFQEDAEIVGGALAGRQTDIDRLSAMAKEYQLVSQKGLEQLMAIGDTAAGLNNKNLQVAVEALRSGLDELAKLSSPKTAEDVKKLIAAQGTLIERQKESVEIMKDIVQEDVDRERRLGRRSLDFARVRTASQIENTSEQADLQIQLARQQADPTQVLNALKTQLQINQRARDARELDALRQYDLEVANAKDTLINEPQARAIEKAGVDRDSAIALANSERDVANRSAAENLAIQLQRRQREESLQLVQDLTNPIRGFLLSSKNFSRDGYRQLGEGVGQAAQQRIVDVFMRRVFSEAGLLGNTLATAFQNGGVTTQTAIERGFLNGAQQAVAVMAGKDPAKVGSLLGGATMDTGAINVGSGNSVPLADIGNANVSGAALAKNAKFKDVLEAAGPLIGSLVGAEIGPKNTYSAEGASVGALFGNMLMPGVGGFVGGLLGGGLGSLLGKGNNDQVDEQLAALDKIERNTRGQIEAIENQTRMLTLDSRFMNVPAGFTVPGFRPFGTPGGQADGATINITVNAAQGQSEERIASLVADAIQSQLRGAGTSFDVRRM